MHIFWLSLFNVCLFSLQLLTSKNNYICSVSATPFSELLNILQTPVETNRDRLKAIVYHKPATGYKGVQILLQSGRIVSYSDFKTTIQNAILNVHHPSTKSAPTWNLLRMNCGKFKANYKFLLDFCHSKGWKVVNYFEVTRDDVTVSSHIGHHALSTKFFLTPFSPQFSMRHAPPDGVHTLVILKEMCRMGTVIPKDHIGFMMETSEKMKADTLLQSFLGRSCGYHNNVTLRVYIPKAVFENNELHKYVNFWGANGGSVENYPTCAVRTK